ncbi:MULTISPECIES: hypothetical protein [unclassified Pseudomonas]|uniref:Uncharacterized protein n=1 Tax=Pseudomonas sp. MYb327 TaxID=2745230 RepID=A0AAU8E1L8_9PSED
MALSAVDANGRPVILSPSVYHSVRLINYKTGELLADGWEAGAPNRFSQALYGVSLEWKEESAPFNPYVRIINYWVSSSIAQDVQIGAVVILNDNVIRSNNTTVGHKFDSSVFIEAQPPVTYDLTRFHLDSVESYPAQATTVTHFYLSLNVDGQQLKLIGWSSKAETGYGVFSRSTKALEMRGFYPDSDFWWRSLCHVASVDEQEVYLVLPPEREVNRPQLHRVVVNDRKGMLSIVQASTLDFTEDVHVGNEGAFYFTVYDVYGNGHDLGLRVDKSVVPSTFALVKG